MELIYRLFWIVFGLVVTAVGVILPHRGAGWIIFMGVGIVMIFIAMIWSSPTKEQQEAKLQKNRRAAEDTEAVLELLEGLSKVHKAVRHFSRSAKDESQEPQVQPKQGGNSSWIFWFFVILAVCIGLVIMLSR